MKTENFRKQHNELLALVGKIQSQLVSSKSIAENSSVLRNHLTSLLGKVQVHLAMEDNSLYPKLVNGVDVILAKMAEEFQTEMGNLRQVFIEFIQTWTATKINEQPEAFKEQATKVFDLLAQRIERENNQLYARYDQL